VCDFQGVRFSGCRNFQGVGILAKEKA